MSNSCYTGQCVVVFGSASLQRYIFQSNRLKENIGASYLAKYWLDDGLVESTQADTAAWKKYEKNPRRDLPKNPIDLNKDVNVIYIGGGNAALLCKSRKIAKDVVKAWSRELLVKASEFRVVVGYGDVDDSLAQAYQKALKDAVRCEEKLPFGGPLYGLPVVRTCPSTGLPASKYDKGGKEWVSQSTWCKVEKVDSAQKDIRDKFPTVLDKGQDFATDLDKELGGRKGESHIAVVHADGNGMGKQLIEVINNNINDDDKFLHHLRTFSASTTDQAHRALKGTLLHLKSALQRIKNDLAVDTSKIFPLRPIVYGGDDLTFVCDGRLGLGLAACYLREFEDKIKVGDEDKCLDACAGVAIVPTKFPFARAYSFADDLCGLAKQRRREKGENTRSWLDFQIIQEGATKSIAELREVQYRSFEDAVLHKRPYQVTKEKEGCVEIVEEFRWQNNFVAILKVFQSSQWPRSRAKGLLQVLIQGSAATKNFIDGARWRGVEIPPSSEPGVSDTGWTENTNARDRTTPYFDPLEALDFYIALDDTDT